MDKPLPGLLGEIEEVAGRDAALKIARAYGGTTVYIPGRAYPDLWLSKCVGEETARRICDYFSIIGPNGQLAGSVKEIVPMAEMNFYGAARREALDGLQRGMSIRAVARAVRVHERSVFRWRKRFISEGLLEAPAHGRRKAR